VDTHGVKSLYLKMTKVPVTLHNRTVGHISGRFKCQFTTDAELRNDLQLQK